MRNLINYGFYQAKIGSFGRIHRDKATLRTPTELATFKLLLLYLAEIKERTEKKIIKNLKNKVLLHWCGFLSAVWWCWRALRSCIFQ